MCVCICVLCLRVGRVCRRACDCEYVFIGVCVCNGPGRALRASEPAWPLHDIAITNRVWHVLQQRKVGGNTLLRNSVGDEGR